MLEDILGIKKISTIFTDLDNTLWTGILAEKQETKINEEYYEFLKSAYNKGICIYVISKNDSTEVQKNFEKLGIEKELFVSVLANWQPKYLTIDRLIEQTKTRPETSIFIDDNDFELEEVKKKIRNINCLNYNDWNILKNTCISAYVNQPSNEIKERINRYRTAIENSEHVNKEDPEYIKTLDRRLSITQASPDNIDKIARLFNVTHRINFNPDEFKDYEKTVEYLFNQMNTGNKIYYISANENNVSLGLTGALVLEEKTNIALVNNATFSCGIMGRGFEKKTLSTIAETLKNEGKYELDVMLNVTPTNQGVKNLLEEMGFKRKGISNERTIYSLDLKEYRTLDDTHIKLDSKIASLDYVGIPEVQKFYNNHVKPIIKPFDKIVNLGSARGEVLGLMQDKENRDFYGFMKDNYIEYKKIDLEYIPEENNIVGNAENLKGIIEDNSQDLVMAIELLEHSEHYWNILSEMNRVCRPGGHIFITVPNLDYPKHEYPIDLWRIGPKTLSSFFPEPYFRIKNLEKKGQEDNPWRSMILVEKLEEYNHKYSKSDNGKINWQSGLTIYP